MTTETDERYHVVVNNEGQYSVWRDGTEPPAGWYHEGTAGTRDECLTHIGVVWTDMRPLSLRDHMDRLGRS